MGSNKNGHSSRICRKKWLVYLTRLTYFTPAFLFLLRLLAAPLLVFFAYVFFYWLVSFSLIYRSHFLLFIGPIFLYWLVLLFYLSWSCFLLLVTFSFICHVFFYWLVPFSIIGHIFFYWSHFLLAVCPMFFYWFVPFPFISWSHFL